MEPEAAVRLLQMLVEHPPIRQDHAASVLQWMHDTPRGPGRIKGRLPPGTSVMHKPGSSATSDGFTAAWNDIGLIKLPNGRYLVIAVFITDSAADERARNDVIARISRAAYDESCGHP